MPIGENKNHYSGSSVYFYVPKTGGEDQNTANDNKLGAFLRLGEFSDVEETAADQADSQNPAQDQDNYYPLEHIADSRSRQEALDQAAGGTQGSKGILMSCDGRVLIKAGERMYTQVLGDKHDDVDGNYTLAVEDDISIRSELGEVTIESGPGRDIVLSAGNGSGTLIQRIENEDKIIANEAADTIHGNKYSKVIGKSTSIVEGYKHLTTGGLKTEFNYGGVFTLNGTAEFSIKPFALAVTAMDVGIKVGAFNMKKYDMDLIETVKLNKTALSLENAFAQMHNAEVEMSQSEVQNTTRLLSSAQSNIETRLSSIESLISRLRIYGSDVFAVT
ncbi:hypothetical protein E1180_11120 [Roseibium denhamense]|uniref:Uncharacterized protein n=1 Tax=Roseibium denhamense TaxID=76305 RepID=A0ABY1N6B5_9HYPH|nr:hypothetical protein [Roseibium denhamense]MTI06063.1 hypothetical protein [Roseibium denhamense]SMP01559.1 hypothetical protein SAMN06265374_0369 [Roseibium denhamense]